MNPGGEDLTAQERVVYLREPRRPVFRSDLAGEESQGRGAGGGCEPLDDGEDGTVGHGGT